ncbi:hypothetical protein ACFVX6_11535 [Streptomyces sp. NPDC058289]|uniref:hypothetical protein n=1 Tax=Streptomyces sp. NPDC058289 TaxID=3346425 RepID=UPI0036DFAE35
MRVTFFVLVGTSMFRFVQRHTQEARAPWVIALAVVLAVLYAFGPSVAVKATHPAHGRAPWPAARARAVRAAPHRRGRAPGVGAGRTGSCALAPGVVPAHHAGRPQGCSYETQFVSTGRRATHVRVVLARAGAIWQIGPGRTAKVGS